MTKRLTRLQASFLFFLTLCSLVWGIASARPAVQESKPIYSPHGTIKLACQNCHTTEGWKPIRPSPDFNHGTTRYPLQGKHAQLGCRACHTTLVFADIGMRCADCHADIHRRLNGNNCEECHSVQGWQQIKQKTNGHVNRFPLWGAHAAVQCEGCHKSAATGIFRGLSTECSSCHIKDYRSAKNPDHPAAGFPTRCETCHRVDGWLSGFDHARSTGFPLVGAHARLDCAQCHPGGRFAGTPATCIGCHLQDFNSTTNPNHVSAGFSQNCTGCHSMSAWTPATFNHSATAFPLTGAHTSVACANCHIGGKYAGTPTDCFACHTNDYTATTNPNHATAGFPHTCTTCHNTSAWIPSTFSHSTTAFPLTGAHTAVACASCHVGGVYAGTPTDCFACHTNDYTATTNPNHATAGFTHTCTTCHNTSAWIPSTFSHSTTAFPLTGAHTTVACVQCHVGGRYAGTPTDCYSCHTQDFNSTTNPNHSAQSFPQTCTLCHSTTAWIPSTFNHSTTAFPLTGAHTTVACANCHVGGVYTGTPTDCYSCHSGEYNTTTDPNHAAAAFPKTCADCHSTSSWSGATFTHAKFPIYSGTHAGRWTTCADCHTNSGDYSVFTCTTACHPKGNTDSNHQGVSNYVYNSANCYSCHPTGRSD
jgi:nitrate/TMAO reductase-like tetraheme cytochrome c subunit